MGVPKFAHVATRWVTSSPYGLNMWQGRRSICKPGYTGDDCKKCIVKLEPGERCRQAFQREVKIARSNDDAERLNYLEKKIPGI